MNFDSIREFDLKQYYPSKVIHLQTMNKEQTIFRVDFKNVPSIYLANEGAGFKIAIHPDDQKSAEKTKEYRTGYLALLKANILRYHMVEADLLGLDRETLSDNINEALAPLAKWALGDNMPSYFSLI